jgi:histone-arginine methyltransferase CARM1
MAEACVTARRCSFDPADLKWAPEAGSPKKVRLTTNAAGANFLKVDDESMPLASVRTTAQLAPNFFSIHVDTRHMGFLCESEADAKAFFDDLSRKRNNYERFQQYEEGSVQSYFQYYSKLVNQQNMLQDAVRTNTYRDAIVGNPIDFDGKTAMDIGAGSGILSFFAAQAGAKTVYAVEASSMGEVVRSLADANADRLPHAKVVVLMKPLENIKDDEVHTKVDVIVSEPIGTFLFNERMIETYLCARDRFLKPGGKLFPNVGNLFIAPFSDPTLHWEQQAKDAFWRNSDFYGLDLNAAIPRCQKETFRQPIVDYIDPQFLMAQPTVTRFDFMTCTVEELQNIEIPLDFEINQPCLIHGIAGWFDIVFEGSNKTVTLSTNPTCPGTHWYQIRFLLQTPLAVNAGQRIEGTLKMKANNLQSYYLNIHAKIEGTTVFQEAPCVDLKDPEYRFYSSPNTYCPPGTISAFPQNANSQAQAPQVPEQPTHTPTWQDAKVVDRVHPQEDQKQTQAQAPRHPPAFRARSRSGGRSPRAKF